MDPSSQPFLSDVNLSDEKDHDHDDDKIKSSHRRNLCALISDYVIFILTVTTLLALSGVFLGLTSSDEGHDNALGGLSSFGSSSSSSSSSDKPSHEEIPDSPQYRNADEYVLSPEWDFEAEPTTREYYWTITDAVFNPDGVFRPMILINNQFPGPLVEANDGDTLVVHIANRGVNATSIHFHGLFQNGTNAMDGTVGITQCPIAPGTDFTYTFDVRGQSGTYWYHAHHSAQASDGLVGPVVLHAVNEKPEMHYFDYASDQVIMVQDHYHNTTAELLMDYLQPGKENEEPVPDSALINGRGIRKCKNFEGWECDDSALQHPAFNLERGKKHRLRFINVGALAEFQIQLDEHEFDIIEVDGTDVHPEPFHRLNILPAQRYSIIVEANVASNGDTRNARRHEGHDDEDEEMDMEMEEGGDEEQMDDDQPHEPVPLFWLRAQMVTHCFTGKNRHLKSEMRAVIRYADPDYSPSEEDAEEPNSLDWPEVVENVCRDLDTSLLRPIATMTPPPASDLIHLKASFHIGDWRLSRGFFNESTWHSNVTNPSLYRFLDAAAPENDDDSRGLLTDLGLSPSGGWGVNDKLFQSGSEYVIQTEGIQTLDIAINNFDDGAHPFHLHGHKFWVMAAGKGYPPQTSEELEQELLRRKRDEDENDTDGDEKKNIGMGDPQNPLRRDTVTVAAFEWTVIRVLLDNPGFWALHCHNTWHSEAGMVMQLLVRAEVVKGWSGDGGKRRKSKKRGLLSGSKKPGKRHEGHDDDDEEMEGMGHMEDDDDDEEYGEEEEEEIDDLGRYLCYRPGVEKGVRPDDSIWFGQF